MKTLSPCVPPGALEVLVVDRGVAEDAALAEALRALGHSVSSVPEDLLQLDPAVEPPVVVLTHEDAAAVVRRLRTRPPLDRAGLLWVVLNPSARGLQDALQAGLDDVVVAPASAESLRCHLGAVATLARLRPAPGSLLDPLLRACQMLVQREAELLQRPVLPAPDPAPALSHFPHSAAVRLLEATSDGVLVTDPEGTILDVNPGFCRQCGYTREELLGKNPRMLKSDRHDSTYYEQMWQGLLGTGHWEGELWDRRKNGEVYPRWVTMDAVKDASGRTQQYVAVGRDISTLKRTEAELERLAHYDALTGLPNRVLFRDRLELAMAQSRRHERPLAVLYMDLDGFGSVNNTLGHRAGDALLVGVAERVNANLRGGDTFARLAGDEFVLLLPDLADTETVAPVARKVLEVLSEPFTVEGREVVVTASLGAALFPQDGQSPEELVKRADEAMYHAKHAGKNACHFYSSDMHQKAVARLNLESDLRRALERGELVPYFQPRVDLHTGRILGAEAVVRWLQPKGATIPPGRFLPVAEQSRLVVPLDEFMLRAACRQQRAWVEQGLPPIRISVNLSPPAFDQRKLMDRIAGFLIETGMDPNDLELEITEGTAIRDPDAAISTIMDLKSIGIHVAIDDFGTGYSAFNYLRRFPVDVLKIDRSFIMDIPASQADAAIVNAIISVGHSLGMEVLAEGVETPAQLHFLRAQGCDEMQGFLASRPLPAADMGALLRAGTPLLAGHLPQPRVTPPRGESALHPARAPR